jgi:hypothetical protein
MLRGHGIQSGKRAPNKKSAGFMPEDKIFRVCRHSLAVFNVESAELSFPWNKMCHI